MPYQVFISHSTEDKNAALAICARLEAEQIRCWIAPRDLTGGADWAEAIINALNGCRILILVFSANANESPQVRREVQRAFEKGLVVMPFRIEDVPPNAGLEFYIGSVHWLDALTAARASHRNPAESGKGSAQCAGRAIVHAVRTSAATPKSPTRADKSDTTPKPLWNSTGANRPIAQSGFHHPFSLHLPGWHRLVGTSFRAARPYPIRHVAS